MACFVAVLRLEVHVPGVLVGLLGVGLEAMLLQAGLLWLCRCCLFNICAECWLLTWPPVDTPSGAIYHLSTRALKS